MNIAITIENQTTLTNEQWAEINKLARIGKIKNAIADLMEDAPELEIDSLFDFLHGLTVRELKNRK